MGVVLDNLDVLAQAFRGTVGLTVWSFVLAFLIGTLIAAFRVSPVAPLRSFGVVWTEVFRNTPLLVLMVLFFFGFPKLGVRYSPFVSAVIVLSAYTSAFIAETIRAGINTVAVGQAEAARALGLTFPQTLRIVVLPQALRTIVAPLGSVLIALEKNTSIAFAISVLELSKAQETLINDTAQPVAITLGVAIAYLLITVPSGIATGWLERKVAIRR